MYRHIYIYIYIYIRENKFSKEEKAKAFDTN